MSALHLLTIDVRRPHLCSVQMFQALLLASPTSLGGSVRKVSNAVVCTIACFQVCEGMWKGLCTCVLMCTYADVSSGYHSSEAFNLDFFLIQGLSLS